MCVCVCVCEHSLIQDTCCRNRASLILILHQTIATLSPRYQVPLSLYPGQSNLSWRGRRCRRKGHGVLIRARLAQAKLFIFILYASCSFLFFCSNHKCIALFGYQFGIRCVGGGSGADNIGHRTARRSETRLQQLFTRDCIMTVIMAISPCSPRLVAHWS